MKIFKLSSKPLSLNKSPITTTPIEKYHAHTGFKVYLNGKAFDFSQSQYQSTEAKELNKDVHLHDGNGDIIHFHKKDISLNDFFSSLGMDLTSTCFSVRADEKYCSSGNNKLSFYVNGKENPDYDSYKPQDLDRILITFGSLTKGEIDKQIASVSDNACLFSEKCPERGKPPIENCVGGLGSDCVEADPSVKK